MAAEFDGPQACNCLQLITIDFRETIPDNHPVRFIDQFVENISVTVFEEKYKVGCGLKGRAPKDVRLMLKIILYAIYCRIYSARKIDYATEHYADFWFFTHQQRISHDKISDFIVMHGDDLHTVFLETVSLAHTNDLLSFDALYQDGFKVKANASKQKNYTHKGLSKKEQKLSENLTEVIEQLKDRNDDESLIKEKKKLQGKLLQIRDLRDELEKRIATRSERKSEAKKQEVAKKTVINTTDPDSEFMKQKDDGNANSYLKITGIDNKADIIISSTVAGHDHESIHSLPLFNQANMHLDEINSAQKYDKAIGDSGFTQMGACDEFEKNDAQLIGPTKEYEIQNRHHKNNDSKITFHYDEKTNTVTCSEDTILTQTGTHYRKERDVHVNRYTNKAACQKCLRLKECTKSDNGFRRVEIDPRMAATQRTLEKYCSEEGQSLYKKRSHVAETFQGDLKGNGRFVQFLLRGLGKVIIESTLHDIVWNLRRIITVTSETAVVWST